MRNQRDWITKQLKDDISDEALIFSIGHFQSEFQHQIKYFEKVNYNI